ncbi:DUF1289 domain-containing protein [Pseudoalteromonas sp. MMG022]|uniref:DUF1289 domain-containing protein n=1 Tax=Pseudoalteromonas sp. MMG022 TaxID=2909978 RepID=UPI0031BA7EC6
MGLKFKEIALPGILNQTISYIVNIGGEVMNKHLYGENQPVESPCVRSCCLNDKDVCLGCGRTLAEILAWGKADTVQRLKILECSERRKKHIAAPIYTNTRCVKR